MKSSTLRRANLSKEKIQVLEKLAKYRRKTFSDGSELNEQNQDKEIDILWNFKHNNKQDKAPTVYLITGFVVGILITIIVSILIQMSLKSVNPSTEELITKVPDTKLEDTAMTFIPLDNEAISVGEIQSISTVNEKVYVVQEGDTLESIVKKFYGSFSMDHVNAIKEANKMKNPNALSIGQKLIIPLK